VDGRGWSWTAAARRTALTPPLEGPAAWAPTRIQTHARASLPPPGGFLNIRDAYAHPLFNPTVDARTGFRTRNLLCAAVNDDSGAPIAVLQASGTAGGGRSRRRRPAGARCAVDSTAAAARERTSPLTLERTHPHPRAQALNKRGGADFSAVDEEHLKLFSVHLGNTLAKIRFYEEAK
jgi:GAF domain-containing protein